MSWLAWASAAWDPAPAWASGAWGSQADEGGGGPASNILSATFSPDVVSGGPGFTVTFTIDISGSAAYAYLFFNFPAATPQAAYTHVTTTVMTTTYRFTEPMTAQQVKFLYGDNDLNDLIDEYTTVNSTGCAVFAPIGGAAGGIRFLPLGGVAGTQRPVGAVVPGKSRRIT